MAISPRSSARGDPGEKPGTVARRLHPGHGFPPDIATHCPRPREGAGEERRRRGRGGGCQRGIRVACRRRRGRGGGCRQKRMGIPHEGAGGVGGASRRVWVLPRKSRRSKGASELRGPPLPKARVGRRCRRGIRLPCSGAGRVAICPLTLPPGRSVHHCRPDSRELPWPSREFIVGAVQDHRRGQFHATR